MYWYTFDGYGKVTCNERVKHVEVEHGSATYVRARVDRAKAKLGCLLYTIAGGASATAVGLPSLAQCKVQGHF